MSVMDFVIGHMATRDTMYFSMMQISTIDLMNLSCASVTLYISSSILILLDSGSDGDLLFVYERTKLYIPYKERYAPQKWRTSNGTFTITKVGKMKLIFPEFSSFKDAYFSPDIITVMKSAPSSVYDLIIGIKSLTKIGAILHFSNITLTIDKVTFPMHHHDSFMDLNQLSNSLREHLEPQLTLAATHLDLKILDASYDKKLTCQRLLMKSASISIYPASKVTKTDDFIQRTVQRNAGRLADKAYYFPTSTWN